MSLGQPLPNDNLSKLNLLWKMLSEYCETFKNILKGKYDSQRMELFKNEGGYKIKEKFRNLLEKYTGDYKATAKYTDEDISYALMVHEGDSIPGFPSIDAFYYLLKPELGKLKDPIQDCLIEVFQYLDMLSSKIIEKTFKRFPNIISDMNDFVSQYLNSERDKTAFIVDSVVDMEINYLFTNDYNYLNNFTTFIPKNQEKSNLYDTKNVRDEI
jgi:hypothetical protein